MEDDFALLGLNRSPWIDLEALRSRFLSLSSEVHPDRSHGASPPEREAANQKYARLNAAYNRLKEPRDRLLLLLELERGARPATVQAPPPEITDLGFDVGRLGHEVDRFLEKQADVTSPMLKVQLFEEAQRWTERLTEVTQRLNAMRDALVGELESFNPAWSSAPPPGSEARVPALPLARIEQIYTLLSYLNRWIGQMQERTVQLCL